MTQAALFSSATAPRQYKDKSPQPLADQREGSPKGRDVGTPQRPIDSFNQTIIPNHVKQCHGNGGREWYIYVWDPENPALVTRVPYMCNSWRCPHCGRHEAAICFARTKAAFEGIEDFDPKRVAFGVLTLDRHGHYKGEGWGDDPLLAYKAMSPMLGKLLKRVNRYCKKMGWEPVGSRYVATVEKHKSGWPHLQIMMYVPEEWAEEIDCWEQLENELKSGEENFLPGWFGSAARETGWGRLGTLSVAADFEAVAGYLTKTAGSHDTGVGELVKLTQVPLNAPPRFRRIRAGKGFLPPRTKGKKTGTMVRRRWCEDGTPQVEPLHNIKDEKARELAAECCYKEEALWRKEVEGRAMVVAAEAVWPAVAELLKTPRLLTWSPRRPRGPPPVAGPETPPSASATSNVVWVDFSTQMKLALPYNSHSS